jgi:ABC-2 type transport system permease protein
MTTRSVVSAERTSGGGTGEPGGSPVAGPRTWTTLPALYRLLVRTQLTLARILGIGALGALTILLGAFASQDLNPEQAATDAAVFALGLVVPLAALWLGTSTIGDLVEDRLLVYLWLKPVPRWQLPAAALAATTTVVVPLTVLPLTAAAAVAEAGDVVWATPLAASLAALAYSGLFVAAGFWFRRAVWWGLAFVLVWENLAAYTSDGAGRFTVIGWASSVLGAVEGIDIQLDAGSVAGGIVVLPALALASWLAATWRYGRADVD